jgi:hypothetical protein
MNFDLRNTCGATLFVCFLHYFDALFMWKQHNPFNQHNLCKKNTNPSILPSSRCNLYSLLFSKMLQILDTSLLILRSGNCTHYIFQQLVDIIMVHNKVDLMKAKKSIDLIQKLASTFY